MIGSPYQSWSFVRIWESSNTLRRSKYRFGRTLGAGTYGIVREADDTLGGGKVAIKIIMKKSVKGNEQMVKDEMFMLSQLHHPHIVSFVEWFESKVSQQRTTADQCFDTNRINGTL
jgi:calcium/calmodulin-dependent protein kinase I